MTIKQKFSSIDQSKLTADQKAFLDKIKNVTKNFTDAEMNKKVETPLDNFIAKAKDKMPEAIKSAPVKRTAKAKTSQTRKPKRTAMSLAKEIRKEGESWKDAQVRARKMMKEDSQSLSKTVESELDKLTKLVRSQKDKEKLAGISGTDIKRDAVRKAKPRGARKVTRSGETSNQYGTYKNHLGRKYYESRDRHSDRLAPRYPKNAPLLAEGGYLTDPTFGTFQNQVFAEGGDIDAFTLRMVKSNGMQPAEVLKEDTNVKYNRGGAMTNERLHVNHDEDYEVRYAKPRPHRKGYKGVRAFELGGNVVTDLAGHTGGSLGTGDPSMLDGVSGTAYTGLVGETGAMSSGEMFANGGEVKFVEDFSNGDGIQVSKSKTEDGKTFYTAFVTSYPFRKIVPMNDNKDYVVKRAKKIYSDMLEYKKNEKYELGGGLPSGVSQSYMITESLGNPAQHFATGGGVARIYEVGIDEGDIKGTRTIADFDTEKEAKDFLYEYKLKHPRAKLFIDSSKSDFFYSQYGTDSKYDTKKSMAKGGGVRTINGREYSYGRNWTNDHRHINQDEEHEVTYNRKGKFLGIFKEGGAIKNQYAGRTPEDIWNNLTQKQKYHFLQDHRNEFPTFKNDLYELAFKEYDKLPRRIELSFKNHVLFGEYNKGGALTNERKHVNHDEDYEVRYAKPRPKRKGYKGARKFMAGGSMETPKIYVADLEAYNNGRLSGVWLDLADYNDADELMDAIQDFLKTSGGEEYAIHDVEYVPRSLYSEYMSKNDFEALYEVMETAKRYDLPLEVVEEIVSQYGEGGVEEFYGKYDDAEDFAMQLVDDIGIESFNSYEYYMYVTDTDRRLISQEQADFYVDDIRNEDGGNRLIEEAGMNVDEYEEADSEMQEEMLDKAREIVYDEYYDTWYEGLDDPKNFLVDEQGIYDTESFANLSFVRVDYEKLGRDLDQDYTFIEHDGDLYVFNIR